MNGYLIDTNVISELIKSTPAQNVVQWFEMTPEVLLHLSVLTLGEIRKGISSLPIGRRKVRLEAWLDVDLVIRFSERILPVDAGVADRWGRIAGSSAAKKSPLPTIDGLLAATAFHFDLTVVTHDTTHFAAVGVPYFDPWQP